MSFVNSTTGWVIAVTKWGGDSKTPTPGENIGNRLVVFRTTDGPLDVGAGPVAGGFLFTQDGGKNFARVESGGYSIREVAFSSPQHGWAVGTAINHGDYLIRTTNGGKSWTQVFPRPRPTVDISFVDNEHGFGLGQLADAGALLASSDGGDLQRL